MPSTIFKQMLKGHYEKKLLMLLTQQIIHSLHRIESRKRYFNEHRVPVTHCAIPQAGKFKCFKIFAVL